MHKNGCNERERGREGIEREIQGGKKGRRGGAMETRRGIKPRGRLDVH